MFNVQEQEERDYYPANDYQNAYALSSMRLERGDSRINDTIAEGKVAVIVVSYAYCPITDAAMGAKERLEAAYNTREEATTAAKELNDKFAHDEMWFEVRPSVPVPVALPESASIDDIVPF